MIKENSRWAYLHLAGPSTQHPYRTPTHCFLCPTQPQVLPQIAFQLSVPIYRTPQLTTSYEIATKEITLNNLLIIQTCLPTSSCSASYLSHSSASWSSSWNQIQCYQLIRLTAQLINTLLIHWLNLLMVLSLLLTLLHMSQLIFHIFCHGEAPSPHYLNPPQHSFHSPNPLLHISSYSYSLGTPSAVSWSHGQAVCSSWWAPWTQREECQHFLGASH